VTTRLFGCLHDRLWPKASGRSPRQADPRAAPKSPDCERATPARQTSGGGNCSAANTCCSAGRASMRCR
jgi:hypothetical protein